MAGHTHGATSGRLLWLSLGLTAAFVGVEAVFGLRAHSLALLSDAGHNASDALALGLAAYAVWLGKRPASRGKTFGYGRAAILTALANAAALVVIALVIFAEAWQAWRHPQPVQGGIMIGIALVAVVMNTLIASWLSPHSHSSLNARAAYIHMMGDALSSAGVVVAGLVVRFTHWTLADPLVSVLIGAFILYSSWGILGEATNVLLEGTPKGLDVDALVGRMRATPPVQAVHDLHVWTVGDGTHYLSCHVVLPDTTTMWEASGVVSALNQTLHDEFAIGHATIQIERENCDGCRADQSAVLCGQLDSPAAIGCGHAH